MRQKELGRVAHAFNLSTGAEASVSSRSPQLDSQAMQRDPILKKKEHRGLRDCIKL